MDRKILGQIYPCINNYQPTIADSENSRGGVSSMADEQLRWHSMGHVHTNVARTDWENIDAPRELVSVDYSNLEARWILPEPPAQYGRPLTVEALRSARNLIQQEGRGIRAGQVNHITATEVRERQEARRRMINEMLTTYGKIFPTPEKEQKQEIKRGNPWVQ